MNILTSDLQLREQFKSLSKQDKIRWYTNKKLMEIILNEFEKKFDEKFDEFKKKFDEFKKKFEDYEIKSSSCDCRITYQSRNCGSGWTSSITISKPLDSFSTSTFLGEAIKVNSHSDIL